MWRVEITAQGYLHLPAALAARHFSEDTAVLLSRSSELWVLPLHRAQAGGLLLKQRNREGDRSVLIWESLPEGAKAGEFSARWDESAGALRIALQEHEAGFATNGTAT